MWDKILEEIEIKKEKCLGVVRVEIDPMEIAIHREQYKGLRMAEDIIRKHLNDGWIPVDDRDHMPDAGEHVLVSIGAGFNPEKAFLSEDGRWMMLHAPDGYNDITDEVEAWMPLPDSYRPERSVEE